MFEGEVPFKGMYVRLLTFVRVQWEFTYSCAHRQLQMVRLDKGERGRNSCGGTERERERSGGGHGWERERERERMAHTVIVERPCLSFLPARHFVARPG